MDKAIKDFWWGFNLAKQRNLTLKSWKSICTPKCEGGLGLRLMQEVNMAKLTRKMLTQPDFLWVKLLKAKYLKNEEFWSVGAGYNSSWTWRSILQAREVVKKGYCKTVGNWENKALWIPTLLNCNPMPENSGVLCDPNMRMKDLFSQEVPGWDLDKLNQFFNRDSC